MHVNLAVLKAGKLSDSLNILRASPVLVYTDVSVAFGVMFVRSWKEVLEF